MFLFRKLSEINSYTPVIGFFASVKPPDKVVVTPSGIDISALQIQENADASEVSSGIPVALGVPVNTADIGIVAFFIDENSCSVSAACALGKIISNVVVVAGKIVEYPDAIIVTDSLRQSFPDITVIAPVISEIAQ